MNATTSTKIDLEDLVDIPEAPEGGLFNPPGHKHPNDPTLGHKYTYHVATCQECSDKTPDAYDQAMLHSNSK